jgi:hypothetical protein
MTFTRSSQLDVRRLSTVVQPASASARAAATAVSARMRADSSVDRHRRRNSAAGVSHTVNPASAA